MNIINSNDHIRDLGITMSGDCSFNEHINMRAMKCRQLTGWILRTFKARDECVMLILFKSLVLPRLEYGCQLWSPTSVNQTNAIENMQRKCYISGFVHWLIDKLNENIQLYLHSYLLKLFNKKHVFFILIQNKTTLTRSRKTVKVDDFRDFGASKNM